MKLTTIRRDGQARPALVVTNEGLRAKWCVDLAEINALASDPTANLSVEPIPASVLGIIRAGPSALENLKRLQDLLLDSIAGGGQERFGRALVRPDAVYWLPPIPDSPLFITFHGNSVGLWRDRSVGMAQRPIISRVPACRLHLVTSNLGHQEPLIFAEGDSVQYGNELGVVIAPGGKNISYEDADDHVWGVMNCDDVTRFTWAQHLPPVARRDGSAHRRRQSAVRKGLGRRLSGRPVDHNDRRDRRPAGAPHARLGSRRRVRPRAHVGVHHGSTKCPGIYVALHDPPAGIHPPARRGWRRRGGHAARSQGRPRPSGGSESGGRGHAQQPDMVRRR